MRGKRYEPDDKKQAWSYDHLETMTENLIRDKSGIRARIRERRKTLDAAWAGEAGVRAQRLVASLAEWAAAEIVFCYIAMPGEVRTDILMRECRLAGKIICIPAFREASGSYEPALYDENEPLGRSGAAPEPARARWMDWSAFKIGPAAGRSRMIMAIVPGVAFDRAGNRLGRGSGHYDHMLSTAPLKDAFKVGLAFEFQVLDSVPAEKTDVRMDAVITENNVYRA